MTKNIQINLEQISQKFKPLSNFDIEKISIPLNITNGTIINLDSEGSGTHWVCWIFRNDCDGNKILIFFDSVGESQYPLELVNILKSSEYPITQKIRNMKTFQKSDDPPICGHLCLAFLKYLNMDFDIYKCIDLFTETFQVNSNKIQWCRYISNMVK